MFSNVILYALFAENQTNLSEYSWWFKFNNKKTGDDKNHLQLHLLILIFKSELFCVTLITQTKKLIQASTYFHRR